MTQQLRTQEKLVLLAELEKRVKSVKDDLRKEFQSGAVPGDRLTAVLDGQKLGSVTYTKGREAWKHNDPAATLAWAKEHAPHLVETKEVIPDAHLTALKKEPVTADGEVIPGFEPVVGDPYASIRPEKNAGELIEAGLASGALSWTDVLELEQ